MGGGGARRTLTSVGAGTVKCVVKVLKGLGIAAACVAALVLALVFDPGVLKGLGDAAIQDALSEELGKQLDGPAGDPLREYMSRAATTPATSKDNEPGPRP
jgi:hypothetical protein